MGSISARYREKRPRGGRQQRTGRLGTIPSVTETIGHILNAVGRHAPWLRAAAWDPVGLQLGDPARPAHRIAVCHEVTESVVTQLSGFDLVVSYHPLLFRPLRRLVAGTDPGGRALRLIEAGTAVAAVHTNVDAAPGGTADALAAELGLTDCRSFGPIEGQDTIKVAVLVPAADADRVAAAMAAAGAGHIGNYSGCSFRLGGTGTFVAEHGARPAIGSVGRAEQVAEVRLEMIAPTAREADVIAALVSAHPYEEPAFDVYDVRANLGLIGRVGTVERQPIRAFAATVQAQLGGTPRVAGNGEVERVAVVPGSGLISSSRHWQQGPTRW